ncbi:unnamed protein product [Amoebophrya sp. A25]|nr:unnamed protein product [Amoebophrya sp. A25]|eukprot:GSA25T00024941001.1
MSLVTGLRYRRLDPATGQRIKYITPFGGQRTETRIYLVHLGGMCEYDLNTGVMTANGALRTVEYPWENQAGQWYSEIDATMLTRGMVYRICMDYDGINTEKYFADTFQQVYILSISILTPGIVQKAGQEIRFECADCVAGATALYLTAETDCDVFVSDGSHTGASPATADAVVLATDAGAGANRYVATVDASGLTSGNRYTVCMDLDGATGTLPFGFTELTTYITGATLNADTVVAADVAQDFSVICSVCTPATSLYLASAAVGCDTTDFDAGQVAVGADSSASAPLVSALGTSPWTVSVDAELLSIGDYYTICTDLDGTATALASGDAQQFVYISPPGITWRSDPINGTDSYIDIIRNHTNVINSAPGQKLFIVCPSGCTANDTIAYLGTTCQTGAAGAVTSMDTKLVAEVSDPAVDIKTYADGTLFSVVLDATSVPTGGIWKLCLVVASANDQPGWSQLTVHTTPATGILTRHRYLKKELSQIITFECPTCVPGKSTAYLARQYPYFVDCLSAESGVLLSTKIASATNSMPTILTNATTAKYLPRSPAFTDSSTVAAQQLVNSGSGLGLNAGNDSSAFVEFEVDATRLSQGVYYHICIDKDGDTGTMTYGDSLQTVYVTPVIRAMTTISNVATRDETFPFEIYCPTCKPTETREINVTRSFTQDEPILVFYQETEQRQETYLDNLNQTQTRTVDVNVTKNFSNGSELVTTFYEEFLSGEMDFLEGSVYATTAYLGSQDCKRRHTEAAEIQLLSSIQSGVTAVPGEQTFANWMKNKTGEEYLDPRLLGRYNFTFDTTHLLTGQSYALCIDMDGKGGPGTYGFSGAEVFVNTFTLLEVEARESYAPTFLPEKNETLRATCGSDALCQAGGVNAYLVRQETRLEPLCEILLSSDDPTERPSLAMTNVLAQPGQISHVQASNTAQSSSDPGVFEFTFDASRLNPGAMYRLCVDYGSNSPKLLFGDTGLTVYVSGVVHLVTTGLVIGLTMAYADVSLFCTGVVDPLNGEQPCSTDSMAYLSTECDQSVVDSVPMNNVTAGTEVVPFRISYLDTQKLTPRITDLLDAGNSDSEAGNDTVVTYVNTSFDTDALFSTKLSSVYNGTLFVLRLNTRKLQDGRHFRLCTDLDGYAGPKYMGDTGQIVYTAQIPFVSTRGVRAVDPQWVNFTCTGCGDGTEGYMLLSYSGRCNVREGGGNATAVAGVQTGSTQRQVYAFPNGTEMQYFPFSAGHLEEGFDYRLCVDLNTTNTRNFFYGDLMYLIYLTPVTSAGVAVLQQGDGGLLFQCPNCTDAHSTAFLAEDCAAEGLSAIRVGVDADNVTLVNETIGTGSGGGIYRLSQDVSQFTLGKHFELCIDMDGSTRTNLLYTESKPMRYSGFTVFVTSIEHLETTSVHAAPDQVIFFRCLYGLCSAAMQGFLSSSFTSCDLGFQVTTPVAFASAGYVGERFYAMSGIDASALTIGREYGLCVDHGNGFGQSGFRVYVHPISGLAGAATLTYRAGVPIRVEIKLCAKCELVADLTYAYLSAFGCKDADRGTRLQLLEKELVVVSNTFRYFIPVPDPETLQVGRNHLICTAVNSTDVSRTFFNTGLTAFPTVDAFLIGNTHVSIYINFAYDFGSTVFYAFPPSTSLSESTFLSPLEYSPEWTGQGWRFASSNGTDGSSNLTLALTNETNVINLTSVIRSTDANRTQRVTFKCDKCGTANGQHALYVGSVCQRSITNGIYPATQGSNTDAVVVYNDNPLPAIDGYYADVNFGFLQSGGSYDVCVDYNRNSTTSSFDYTGEKFLVTGVTGSLNRTLYANLSQTITIVCHTCSDQTKAYLGLECASARRTGIMRKWPEKRTAAATFFYYLRDGNAWNGTLFAIEVDATPLLSGTQYKLCVDEDGPQNATGFEDVQLRFDVF